MPETSDDKLYQQIVAANETLHELLSAALDEPLPEDAEQRCIDRVVRESKPIPIIPLPDIPPPDLDVDTTVEDCDSNPD